MKIMKAFLVLCSGLIFSSSLLAYSPTNQNTTKRIESNDMWEPTLNARFTLAPMMTNSHSKEYGFAADFAINDNLMMGPQLSHHRYSGQWHDIAAYGLGLSMTYSLTENFKDGWFINPSVKLYSYTAEQKGTSADLIDVPKNLTSLSLMYGYKWIFKDGFNIRLAAGLQHNAGDAFAEESYDGISGSYSSNYYSIRGGSGLTLDSDLSVGLIF